MPLQVDEIPLSRPKRNIARDFSDGGGLRAGRKRGWGSVPCSLVVACCSPKDLRKVLFYWGKSMGLRLLWLEPRVRECAHGQCLLPTEPTKAHHCKAACSGAHGLTADLLSSAVLMAEVVHHFFPKLVELHNYRLVLVCTAPGCRWLR